MRNNLPLDLLIILRLNDIEVQNNFFYILNNNCKNDCDGYIYGFINIEDNNTPSSYWIKIGRTQRKSPLYRINEWGGKVEFCIKTKYNK
jgi:hypothetical protein